MSDEEYDKLIEHRDEFVEAFKDYDEAKINEVLQTHPLNRRNDSVDADPENDIEEKIIPIFSWKDCPLKMTAGYYANNKMLGEANPVPDIPELKALLDGKA